MEISYYQMNSILKITNYDPLYFMEIPTLIRLYEIHPQYTQILSHQYVIDKFAQLYCLPSCSTFDEFIEQYESIYGKSVSDQELVNIAAYRGCLYIVHIQTENGDLNYDEMIDCARIGNRPDIVDYLQRKIEIPFSGRQSLTESLRSKL